ncbi:MULTISPECIES: phosphotransferase family protein [Burkholderia cepacia complex]|uniref:phosphotransferase family protein n=1 Tax=Burkholderia cepacia complex TaxID=87882 RepID=UPI000D1AC921|nr:phosphotransferase family protein [Burkholderia metallica]
MNLLSTQALASWMRAQSLSASQNVMLRPLSGGQSNPTFFVADGSRHFVLRKKPPGQPIVSAHAIDREYRVMSALRDSGVPVPRMLGYCEDDTILGTPFFLMEFLDGRVYMDQSLPGVSAVERGAMYRDMNQVTAALHAVDYREVGLGDYGKPGNYFARQIDRWSRQIEASTVAVPRAMHLLMEWLPQHIPASDETTLVHGDYRLDNVVFHPTEPCIIGVLDWELSTLGHPLADFSNHCMSWHIQPQLWCGIAGMDLPAMGIPTESEYMSQYMRTSGRDLKEHWNFCLAFSLFRMAAILHGIAQRAANGTAAAADAEETGRKAGPLAEIGWQCASRYLI